MSDIEIEIDGKKIQTQSDKMVIQAADDMGIYIPRFCYHKHLTVAANCRMCLVEVEKSAKPLPACATPVAPGMKVLTRSPKALAAQRAVMEFLLINHPLDCPICDQGGECELQDLSMGYGGADSYFIEGKRAVKDQDIGPLVETEMTRCIHCTRCVRFGDEIAGMRELGLVQRGEHTEISTYVQGAMRSEVSGNIIDLCPVGALTSKPFRFKARAWELDQFPSIAPHDCLGSNIFVHTRYGKAMRVVPRENELINQTWISDRDRFSYEGLYSAERLSKPLVRKNGRWQETTWQAALELAARNLQQAIVKNSADELGALASPNATVEEFYLLQKIIRGLGSPHVDHRLRQVDFSGQQFINPPFENGEQREFNLTNLENSDVILLIGSHLQKEQPVAALRVRKAVLKGARVLAVNMMDYSFNFSVAAKIIAAPQHFTKALTHLDPEITTILSSGKKVCVLLGALALNHPQAASIVASAKKIAAQYHAAMALMTEGANAAGAWLAGMIPHRGAAGQTTREGLDAQAMLQQPRKSYLLLNVEPDLDCANPVAANQALEQAECVIALSLYKNAVLNEFAHIILPMAPFTETSGSFISVAGQWQSFKGVAKSYGESRPAWKILRVLGQLLHLDGFDYQSSEEVRDEIKEKIMRMDESVAKPTEKQQPSIVLEPHQLYRIGEIPIYASDSLARHSLPLQAAQTVIDEKLTYARLHPDTASKFKVKDAEQVVFKQDQARIRLPIAIDACVPVDAVWIAGGIPETSGLTRLFGIIEVEKI